MRWRHLKKGLAFLLILPLLPIDSVYAAETIAKLAVCCEIAYQEDAERYAEILETDRGYYVTLDAAVDLLKLNFDQGITSSDGWIPLEPVAVLPVQRLRKPRL